MLELNLSAHRPAATEVIAQVDDGMRNVELAVRRVVLVLFGLRVTTHVVAVEVAAVGHFAIATYAEALAIGSIEHTVGCIFLCGGLHGSEPEESAKCKTENLIIHFVFAFHFFSGAKVQYSLKPHNTQN